jgi:hypothetical protein
MSIAAVCAWAQLQLEVARALVLQTRQEAFT